MVTEQRYRLLRIFRLITLREKRLSPRRAPKRSLLPLSPRTNPGSPNTTPALSVWPPSELAQPAEASTAQECRLRLKQPAPVLGKPRGSPLFKSSTRLVPRGSCPSRPSSAGRSASASPSARKICSAYFFDRNRTSKKLRQLPKPRLCCCSQNQLTNRLS
jgi:hypothetical protein